MNQPTLEQVKNHAAQLARYATIASVDSKALHTYKTPDGEPLYWRIRLKCNRNGDKFIRPFMWNGTAFENKEPPAPPEGKPLYGLERLTAHPDAVAIITEGEIAADALNRLFSQQDIFGKPDLVALTSGGAQSAKAADWQPLAGRTVYVFPDNDDPGAQYGRDVVQALQGIAHSAAVLDISPLNLPAKGDAVEWLQDGGTLGGLMELVSAADNVATPLATPKPDNTQPAPATTPATPDSEQPAPAVETEAQIIARLASLSPLAYDRARKDVAERLGVSTTALDKAVALERREGATDNSIGFEDCEPHPHPIDPATLLNELSDTVKRFIVCPDETADAAALWAAFTWFIDVVQVAPIAVITAPEKRCGKSMLLFLLGKLSRRPLTASNISPAALFRVVDAWQPTLLIDEADAFMRDNEELRGLLNCGHTRDSAYTVRIVGEALTPTRFNVWGAKATAGIGHLADTLMDRAIRLELRRKMPHEARSRLRHAPDDLFDTLAAKLARFAEDYRDQVRRARPELPDALNDRAQDNWEPLLAIAECAGPEWLERAWHAALTLSGDSTAQSVGNELLADIQTVFAHKRVEKISTVDLLHALCEDEEAAWATYNRGNPLTPRQLAKRLNDYGIRSKNIRLMKHGNPQKAFELAQFTEAFARYLVTENATL